MEEKPVFKIGDRVDQMCITCNEERGHIVVSLSKIGRITRVECPMCVSRVMYRAGTIRRASNKLGAPYDRTRAYRKGQTLMHPTFGEGEVTAIIEPQKRNVRTYRKRQTLMHPTFVLFADRIRRMMHAHS